MRRKQSLLVLGLILVSVMALFPFAWMFLTSIKTEYEAISLPITWIPRQISLRSYIDIWLDSPFALYFMNSMVISSTTAIISTFIGALAGYGFSRFRFRARKFLVGLVLSTQMLSGVLIIGPYFRVMSSLGLYNTRTCLIIAFTTIALPFCIWMTKGFFDSIPKEIDEAAMMDGCTRWKTFLYTGLPLVVPGMVATFLFAFLLAWQDLLWTMSLTSTESTRTVTMAMAFFVGEFRIKWPTLMASTLVGSAPSIIMYACLQRFLVAGFTAGAVKE